MSGNVINFPGYTKIDHPADWPLKIMQDQNRIKEQTLVLTWDDDCWDYASNTGDISKVIFRLECIKKALLELSES